MPSAPTPTALDNLAILHNHANCIPQLAWVISFISCIIAQINSNATNTFNKFSWWAVIYSLFLIGGTFVVVAIDAVHTYHVAMTGYLSAGLVLTSVAVNSLVYSSNGASEAAAAGFILLSMVLVRATFYSPCQLLALIPTRLYGFSTSGQRQHPPHAPGWTAGLSPRMPLGCNNTSNTRIPWTVAEALRRRPRWLPLRVT